MAQAIMAPIIGQGPHHRQGEIVSMNHGFTVDRDTCPGNQRDPISPLMAPVRLRWTAGRVQRAYRERHRGRWIRIICSSVSPKRRRSGLKLDCHPRRSAESAR
jgi:hypothetical protein